MLKMRQIIGFSAVSLALSCLAPQVSSWADAGGPDAFRNRYIDSSEPGGPGFSFIDISQTGALVVDGDDAASSPIALSIPFPFYGESYPQMVMSSNGYLSVNPSETGEDISSDCPLPKTPSSGSDTRIYVLHADLVLPPGDGAGFYQRFNVCPRTPEGHGTAGCHVFMWNRARHFGSAVAFSFEALLYDNGDIVVQYNDADPQAGFRSTAGIQNGSASTGLTYACHDVGSVKPQLAVLYFYDRDGDGVHDSPDRDLDGIADTSDGCPDDPLKSSAGFCGCGVSDGDTDLNGIPDCLTNDTLHKYIAQAKALLGAISFKGGKITPKGKKAKGDLKKVLAKIRNIGTQSRSILKISVQLSDFSELISSLQKAGNKIERTAQQATLTKSRKIVIKLLNSLDNAAH